MNDRSSGRLAGKVAIVTGGASGIGLATTRRFVAEGARVVIGDLAVDRFPTIQTDLGDAIATVPCDVRIEDEVAALVATAVDRFGGVDIAFANAGIGAFGAIAESDAGDWMRTIEVNLFGPFLTTKYAARAMRDGGSIIYTASLNAVQAAAGMSAYCSSKAALAMLAQVAAMELGPRGIRVNAIGPGLVRTGLTEGMWQIPAIVADFDENAPLATTTSADDVGALVTFLASDESSSITGTLQLIDRGAHTMRYPDVVGHLVAVTMPGPGA
jgi:NAD(P)-dependent dehydrogenase (short-subunit alcohol dehydrogenase family)